MTAPQLHRRWRQRLNALDTQVGRLLKECRRSGGAEVIHDLRVAVRRARLYARLGRPLLRKGTVRRFDAWGRALNELLGPVRDCDVCLNWLAGCPGATGVVEGIHRERVRLWRRADRALRRRRMIPPRLNRFRRCVKDPAGRLQRRLGAALSDAAAEVLKSRGLAAGLKAGPLHEVRRVARRWRYLLELALPARARGKDTTLARLNRIQDALGESQNLEMAAGLLRAHADSADRRRLVPRARREQARWMDRGRAQLARLPDCAAPAFER